MVRLFESTAITSCKRTQMKVCQILKTDQTSLCLILHPGGDLELDIALARPWSNDIGVLLATTQRAAAINQKRKYEDQKVRGAALNCLEVFNQHLCL